MFVAMDAMDMVGRPRADRFDHYYPTRCDALWANIVWLAGDGLRGDKRGVVGTDFEGGVLAGAAIWKFSPASASRISRNVSAADQLRVLRQVSVTPS